MTKKDYELIADVIRNFKREEANDTITNQVEFLIDEFAYKLEKDNFRFNEKKFRDYIYEAV